MRKNTEPLSWQSDLAAFGKRNNMRPTRRLELETTAGRDKAVEIEDGEGRITIMHFESERPA